MSSLLFNSALYIATALFAILGAPMALLPTDKPLRAWISLWARTVRFGMRHIAGITVEIRGREFMPRGETAIIAAKHHSFIDAVLLYAEMPQIAAVAMAELSKIPFVGLVFRRLGMIMIDRTGGRGAHHLKSGAQDAIAKGRPILIYPEGQIAEVGARIPYKKGVWHLQKACDLPVIPVATNIGLRWSQNKWHKSRGHAVVEFLAPIESGKDLSAFMEELETRIEERTADLLVEAGFTSKPHLPHLFPMRPAHLALTADV
jgi:1-acyl-sn-glycerol-3-phosphate acyltransferase